MPLSFQSHTATHTDLSGPSSVSRNPNETLCATSSFFTRAASGREMASPRVQVVLEPGLVCYALVPVGAAVLLVNRCAQIVNR